MNIRAAGLDDLMLLGAFRGADWLPRINGYLQGTHHPQQALAERVIFVAEQNGEFVGWIAGHLTRRFNCHGELQWLDVLPAHRRQGLAGQLFTVLARWFTEHGAHRVCVNYAADNAAARAFYQQNGAESLNEHWLVWPDISQAV